LCMTEQGSSLCVACRLIPVLGLTIKRLALPMRAGLYRLFMCRTTTLSVRLTAFLFLPLTPALA